MNVESLKRSRSASPARGARARRIDRIAAWVISASGILIIASMAAIVVEIVAVALPLFYPARSELRSRFRPAWLPDPAAALAIGTDEYLETGYVLTKGGEFIFFDSRSGKELDRYRLEPPQDERPAGAAAPLADARESGRLLYSVRWASGTVTLEQVHFSSRFDARGERTIAHAVERVGHAPPIPGESDALARQTGEHGVTTVYLVGGNRFRIVRETTETDLLGNATTESKSFGVEAENAGRVGAFLLDHDGGRLFAGTDEGYLLSWNLEGDTAELKERIRAFAAGERITALAIVYGDSSLAVGTSQGRVSTWFPVPVEPGSASRVLSAIHALKGHLGPVRAILPSQAGKTLLSIGADDRIVFHYPTGENDFLDMQPEPGLDRFGLSLRGNGLIGVERGGGIALWTVEAPHPEFNLKALFGRIWYEGFKQPAFVWQSSAGTNDVEPKLSLVPLVFGTFKGTVYALLFAVPIAVLAAIYTSTLMDPRLRLIVKPAVEIMGAMPTVVIGFLAALWFAPLIAERLPAVFAFFVLLPLVLVAFLVIWERLGGMRFFKGIRTGFEFILVIPAILLAIWISLWVGHGLQQAVFGGDFRQWMYETMGTRVDQRNSVVIAFALGFAVIPIIFTISEDALIRVPRHLRAASLALGATRWQTAWRVLLPSASPGIFAAVMIGFGRAVGETMIVLMATGNTPIIDTSIFNGMRTLSANIAVEIPEAPLNGTLYRVLFLSGVLLFIITFFANTVAEMVRYRLRKKYSRI